MASCIGLGVGKLKNFVSLNSCIGCDVQALASSEEILP